MSVRKQIGAAASVARLHLTILTTRFPLYGDSSFFYMTSPERKTRKRVRGHRNSEQHRGQLRRRRPLGGAATTGCRSPIFVGGVVGRGEGRGGEKEREKIASQYKTLIVRGTWQPRSRACDALPSLPYFLFLASSVSFLALQANSRQRKRRRRPKRQRQWRVAAAAAAAAVAPREIDQRGIRHFYT